MFATVAGSISHCIVWIRPDLQMLVVIYIVGQDGFYINSHLSILFNLNY